MISYGKEPSAHQSLVGLVGVKMNHRLENTASLMSWRAIQLVSDHVAMSRGSIESRQASFAVDTTKSNLFKSNSGSSLRIERFRVPRRNSRVVISGCIFIQLIPIREMDLHGNEAILKLERPFCKVSDPSGSAKCRSQRIDVRIGTNTEIGSVGYL